jgi:hypothetical protein
MVTALDLPVARPTMVTALDLSNVLLQIGVCFAPAAGKKLPAGHFHLVIVCAWVVIKSWSS